MQRETFGRFLGVIFYTLVCDVRLSVTILRQNQERHTLLLPQTIKTAEDYDMNIFDFFPDPVHLVETLKAFDRGDMASSLFVKLFERYVEMRAQPDQDPMK